MARKFWSTLAVLLMLAVTVAGCGGSAPNNGSAPVSGSSSTAPADPDQTSYPLTLKDGAGRDVTLAAEPKRIVSVAPATTELLFALGKSSSLVGRSDFCNYPVEVASIPSIGGFHPPNYEVIVAAQPDLLLMPGGSVEAREKLTNEYNINVLVVDPQNFEELYEAIEMLGTAVNAQAAAKELISDMQQQVKSISEKAATAQVRPKVFYEVWHDPLMTAGTHTFIDDLITLAGGENVGASVEGWITFNLEELAAADPDFIVAGSAMAVEQIQERKGWEGMKAVKSGTGVISIPDSDLVVRAGPRLVQGLAWFAESLHPELFKQ